MSLFETLSDWSKQHAESGSYTFKNPRKGNAICGAPSCGCTTAEQCELNKPTDLEPAPTVSLYNLLDHSVGHLSTLHLAVQRWLKEVDDEYEPEENPFYSDLKSWNTILQDAVREKKDRDSLAWAEKTAKL